LCDTVDDRSTPIVATQDDALDAEAFCKSSNGVGVALEGEVTQR
jgi:hypothetical protein